MLNKKAEEYAKEGDSAFPYQGGSYTSAGMSLRDYFAAKAIGDAFKFRQPESGGGGGSFEYVAKIAYEIADAMLAERAK